MIKTNHHHHHIEKPFKVILEDQNNVMNQRYKTSERRVMSPTLVSRDMPIHPVKGRIIDEKI